MSLTKAIGWLIFFAGIFIIVFTLYRSYNIFTGKIPPPEFFKVETKKETVLPKKKTPTSLEEVQQQVGEILAEQLKEILPQESLTKISNLVVWSILAGILILGGSQIAGLGIKLIKT
jgi:hypothetical protein